MKLTVRLFIQRHVNRSYTVTVPLFPGIAAYGPTLEECKQEVAEALAIRLSEVEPDQLHLYTFQSNQSLEKVTVELRPTDQNNKRRRNQLKLTMSLLLTPQEDGQTLVEVPRLRTPSLSFYVSQSDDLQEIAQLELLQYFYGDSLEDLRKYEAARHETLDTLEIDFRSKKATDKEDEEEQETFWALKASGTNLTAQAAEGQLRRAFRRDAEIDQVLAAITSDRRASILLIGQHGVGKTAIVHELARRVRRKECAETLHDRQIWATTADGLIAGCSFIGQWQEKLKDVVNEVRKKRHILFVDDIAALAEAGRHSKGDDNIADFLRPYLQTGDVILIGETTPERLRRAEQLVPGFVSQFRTLDIAPTSETDTLSILTALARELERAEDLRIEPSALEAAVELTNRFLPYRAQPGKAIVLIEQLAGIAGKARSTTTNGPRPILTRREMVAGFAKQTGMPEFIIADTIALDLAAVRAHFADRIIGQDAAVDSMVDLIALVKAGLNDPEKPLGVYMFIGPTGVGKTQLAKTLASYLFGDEKRMLRFDMSEYNDPAAVRRLIGLPGAGRDGDGELTRKVRAQPFCVVLLDEFEKADSQIYDIFLQVLGEGRLTDAAGQTTSFQNAIVIMTSNLGASAREQRTIGLGRNDDRRAADESEQSDDLRSSAGSRSPDYWRRKVEQFFRPEFVNRIDQIVAFQALDHKAMRQIASREIGEVLLREGLVRRNVLVEIDDNVIDLVLEQGFTATYGARPLKRAIERLLVLPLARFLASRNKLGADLLRLRREGSAVVLTAATIGGDEILGDGDGGALPSGMLEVGLLKRRRIDDKGLAEAFATLRRQIDDWNERDTVVLMRDERETCLAATNKPTFWDDGDLARATLARFYVIDRLLRRLQQLSDRAEHLEELAGLVHRQRDARYRAELADGYQNLSRDLAFLEVELLCAHLSEHHRAVMRLRRVGPLNRDEGTPWLTQLATMYLRWSARKGYDVSLFVLEALPEEERGGDGLIPTYYPYKWRPIDTSDLDAALKQLTKSAEASELAIGVEGTNVYGFLKGEVGVHRRNDRRASGERVQRLVDVQVDASGDDEPSFWVDKLLMQRAWEEQDRSRLSKREREALPKPSEPPIVRVYQFDSDKQVRDLRTQLKTNDISTVLDGGIDDFILAALREEELSRD
jgi:ATP-dependent Clp protease ATP-binding subunit ClpC